VRNKASQPAIVLTGFSLFLSSFAFLVLRSQILQGFSHPLSTAGNREMLLTEPAALWFYLSHLVLPLRLGPCYPLAFVTDWRSADFLVPLLSLAAVVAVLGWLFRSLSDRRLFWFCAVWGLAPLIAPLYLKLFPEFELVHDRYLYIPTIALGVALAAGLKRLSNATPGLPIRNYVSIATLVLLLASAAQTISYENVWRNDISLFQRAVALTPRNARALVNLGVNKLQEGDHVEGSALLKRALALQPDNAFALFDLGADAWNNNNDPATAEAYIQKALALEVHSNWLVLFANVELKLGRIPQAESAARDAIALAPNERGAHMLLGLVCLTQRDPATAVHEFSAELELDPEDVAALQAIQVARAQNAQQH
jgi:tetratricopeptide (TPR) repeat protein